MLAAGQAGIPQFRHRACSWTIDGNPPPVASATAPMQPVVRSDSVVHPDGSVFICVPSAFIRVPLGCTVANTNCQGFPERRHPGQCYAQSALTMPEPAAPARAANARSSNITRTRLIPPAPSSIPASTLAKVTVGRRYPSTCPKARHPTFLPATEENRECDGPSLPHDGKRPPRTPPSAGRYHSTPAVCRAGTVVASGLIPFRNLNRSLCVDRTRVVFWETIDL